VAIWVGLALFLLTALVAIGPTLTWSAILLSLFIGFFASAGWCLIKPDAPADRIFASATTTSVIGLGLSLWTSEIPPDPPWVVGALEDWEVLAFEAAADGLVGSILAVRTIAGLGRNAPLIEAFRLGMMMALCTTLVSVLIWALFGAEFDSALLAVFRGFMVGLSGGLVLGLIPPKNDGGTQSAGAVTTAWARAISLRKILRGIGYAALITCIVVAITAAVGVGIWLAIMLLSAVHEAGGPLAIVAFIGFILALCIAPKAVGFFALGIFFVLGILMMVGLMIMLAHGAYQFFGWFGVAVVVLLFGAKIISIFG
jgi:hypothetical protein